MYIHDYRLAQILSDIRLEQARSIRDSRSNRSYRLRNRLGHWLIDRGHHLARRDLELA